MNKNNRCTVCDEIIPEGRQVCPKCEIAPVNRPSYYTEEDEAIKYLENTLKRWTKWKKHHTKLVRSLEIVLSKIKEIKETSKND